MQLRAFSVPASPTSVQRQDNVFRLSLNFGILPNSEFGNDKKVGFLKCDASKYQDVLNLFKYTMEKYGRIDHTIANAGILETGVWHRMVQPHSWSLRHREERTERVDIGSISSRCVDVFSHRTLISLPQRHEN